MRLVLPTFAKINWFLKILGRRPDGFHELRTVFQLIDLHDELLIEPDASGRISLEVTGRPVDAGPENLVWRAAEALRRAAGVTAGARMVLDKRIPIGAGLGGGSSNAAAALLGLNQIWGCGCNLSQLSELAAELGSDVPFFLAGGTAFAAGRGEDLRPLPLNLQGIAILLLYPDVTISTREAYAARDWGLCPARLLTKADLDNTMHGFRKILEKKELGWDELRNDFEDVIFERYPAVRQAAARVFEAGCKRVLLCGSGSTLLGLAAVDAGRRIAETLSRGSGSVFLCHPLSRSSYHQILTERGL